MRHENKRVALVVSNRFPFRKSTRSNAGYIHRTSPSSATHNELVAKSTTVLVDQTEGTSFYDDTRTVGSGIEYSLVAVTIDDLRSEPGKFPTISEPKPEFSVTPEVLNVQLTAETLQTFRRGDEGRDFTTGILQVTAQNGLVLVLNADNGSPGSFLVTVFNGESIVDYSLDWTDSIRFFLAN